tara:strand:+ start:1144 stop:2097 length:954 start_codon:yes stop_codon:yes gene_type:complete
MKPKLIVITPIKHIHGLVDKLEKNMDVTYFENPEEKDLLSIINKYDALFTNPNKSNIFIGDNLLKNCLNLKVVCTASTGTNHIDIDLLKKKNINLISLTNERKVINKISSTAEHAFALTLSSIRNIIPSYKDVLKGNWNYEKFIGRQMNFLNIGVVGYGRLGKMYASFSKAFGAKVFVYDPYVDTIDKEMKKVNHINDLLTVSDIISFHIHVNKETYKIVDNKWFNKMKNNVLLINTSRGEIINEKHLIRFLSKNKMVKLSTDVIFDEIKVKKQSNLIKYAKETDQILITPHIGGMTHEAQQIAYNHAADLLINSFN